MRQDITVDGFLLTPDFKRDNDI